MIDLFSQPEPAKEPTAFWNTTSERGTTLTLYRTKAAAQDQRILAIMQELRTASPSQVWKALVAGMPTDKQPPITSVRRALTNLTTAGRLRKLDTKVPGIFGRPEHQWMVNTAKP